MKQFFNAAASQSNQHLHPLWRSAALSEYNNIQDAVQASMRTASRAADDLNDPREIQRILAEQDKAREAEQKLNQDLK